MGMPKSLRDMKKGNASNINDMDEMTSSQKADFEKLKSKAAPYLNKSEGELMQDIQKMIGSAKAKGTLTKKDVEKFANQIAPMLDTQQREKMRKLVDNVSKQLD